MTGMDHLAVWKRAVPLHQAYIRFAPKDLAAQWEALRQQVYSSTIMDDLKPMIEADTFQMMDFSNKMLTVSSAISKALSPRNDFQNFTTHLQSHCLQLIRSGHILALGYAVPRALADVPAMVPDDLWLHPINWQSSTVSGNGLRMEAVRLALPHWIPKIMADHAAEQIGVIASKPASRGRPSKKPDIIAAFHQLVAAGRVQAGMKLSDCYPLVRALVKETVGGTDEGMNDKTLHSILKPEFDKLR